MASPQRIVVLNGPNLNLLGTREPDKYGTRTLGDVDELCRREAARLGLDVQTFQSNHEGALIDKIQEARETHHGIVINAGGYSHTSIAIADALAAVALPVAEVHVSQVHRREDFRRHSFVSNVADAVFVGAGIYGYAYAIDFLQKRLTGRA